jgi:hypothetical protein
LPARAHCNPDPRHRDDLIPPVAYAANIILHTPLANPERLESFVEACLQDAAVLPSSATMPRAGKTGSTKSWSEANGSRFLVTTAHRDETLAEVMDCVSDYGTGPLPGSRKYDCRDPASSRFTAVALFPEWLLAPADVMIG